MRRGVELVERQRRLTPLLRAPLLRDGIVVFVATNAGSLLNYVFHLVMTRLLGPVHYGALGALLAATLVIAVPTGAIQAVVARRSAVSAGRAADVALVFRHGLRATALAGLGLGGMLAVLAPVVAGFLNLDSSAPVLVLALFVAVSVVGPVTRGVVQGLSRFHLLAVAIVGGAGVKLGLGIPLAGRFGVSGAMAAVVVAEIVGMMIAILPLVRLLRPARAEASEPGGGFLRETGGVIMAGLAYWILVGMDVPLARHYLTEEVAGRYAAATLVGRAVLFLPMFVAVVTYPRLARAPDSPAGRRLLLVSALAVVAMGLVPAGIVFAFPDLVELLFGRSYGGTGPVAVLLAVAMAAYGVVNLLFQHGVAARRPPVAPLWTGAGVQLAAVVLWHGSGTAIATAVLVVGVALAVWMGAETALRPRRAPAAAPAAEPIPVPPI